MNKIDWNDFERIELRIGTVTRVEKFPEAKKPAYKLWADFGEFGVRKSSAQITELYTPEQLVGKQILGVLNFAPKQIANFTSEFLTTGFVCENGVVVLAVPQRQVPNGSKMA